MKIIVVGLGKIGRTIMKILSTDDHDIIAIDNNPDVVATVSNSYDVLALCAEGTHLDVLKDIGACDCDVFIAATSSDEMNIVSCFLAKRLGAKHTVARFNRVELTKLNIGFLRKELELSLIINPYQLTAHHISDILKGKPVSRNVMILGASKTGRFLLKDLALSAGQITIIEKSEDSCEKMLEVLPRNARLICADGTEQAVLEEEQIDNMDAFVSLAGMDEENILVSCYALSRNVPRVITKVNMDGYSQITESLGLEHVISPKDITADIVKHFVDDIKESRGK